MNLISLTKTEILGLAPDPFVIKNSVKELDPHKWSGLGRQDQLAWGEYLRSNGSPYRVKIDLETLTLHCSCKSQKNPCRFALALLLLVQQSPASFVEQEPPEWVATWSRTPTKGGELTVQSRKKSQLRVAHIQRGMADFALWLRDVTNEGLAKLPERAKSVIDPMVDRLHDAHAKQVADELKKMGTTYFPRKGNRPADWPAAVLGQLGQFYLLTQAWAAYDHLSLAQQTDLCLASGQLGHLDYEQDRVTDRWLVLGRRMETTGRQTVRRLWLRGVDSGRVALLIDIVSGKSLTTTNLVTNRLYTGEIGFAPATYPLFGRLQLHQTGFNQDSKNETGLHVELGQGDAVADARRAYADRLAHNPWFSQMPLLLRDVYLRIQDEQWLVVAQDGTVLPLKPGMRQDWNLFAYSMGRPLTLFGELTLNQFEPLSLWRPEVGWSDLIAWGRLPA